MKRKDFLVLPPGADVTLNKITKFQAMKKIYEWLRKLRKSFINFELDPLQIDNIWRKLNDDFVELSTPLWVSYKSNDNNALSFSKEALLTTSDSIPKIEWKSGDIDPSTLTTEVDLNIIGRLKENTLYELIFLTPLRTPFKYSWGFMGRDGTKKLIPLNYTETQRILESFTQNGINVDKKELLPYGYVVPLISNTRSGWADGSFYYCKCIEINKTMSQTILYISSSGINSMKLHKRKPFLLPFLLEV